MALDLEVPALAPQAPIQAPQIDTSSLVNSQLPDRQSLYSQVKGPLGTHGAIGDILGTLMDAVLVNSGLGAQYWPKKQIAKEADALQDFQSDPTTAISNLARVNPTKALDLYNDMIQNQQRGVAAQKTKQDMAKDALLFPGQLAEQNDKAVGLIRSIANTANPKNASAVLDLVKRRFKMSGLDPTSYGLPDAADDVALREWAGQGLDVNKKYTADQLREYRGSRLGQIDRQIDISQQNADSLEGYRGTMGSVAQANSGTAADRAQTYRKDVDDKITDRAKTVKKRSTVGGTGGMSVPIPSSPLSGGAGAPPFKPPKKGAITRSPTGDVYRSPDGVSWVKG